MSTSDRSFNQVRAILGKLDRSITEARERRLQGPGVGPAHGAAPAAPLAAPVPGGRGFGRAQPIPPAGFAG